MMPRVKLIPIATLLTTAALLLPQTSAQTVPPEPAKVILCDLFKDPQSYAGRLVQFRTVVMGTTFKDLWLEEGESPPGGCEAYMTIRGVLPTSVTPSPSFEFEHNRAFETFRSSICCKLVAATITGRFDPVFVWRNHKRIGVGAGEGFGRFGKHGVYDGRVVIERIDDVSALSIPRR